MVLERGCGLTATVIEGVHVDDRASTKPSTPTSITACFKYGNESSNTKIGLLTPIAFGFHGLYLYPASPPHYSP